MPFPRGDTWVSKINAAGSSEPKTSEDFLVMKRWEGCVEDLTERNSTQRKHRLTQASFHTLLEKRVTLQSHMQNHGDKQRDRSHRIRSQFVSLYRDVHTLSRPVHSALHLAKASASLGDIRISTAIQDTPHYESPKKEGEKSSFHICDGHQGSFRLDVH